MNSDVETDSSERMKIFVLLMQCLLDVRDFQTFTRSLSYFCYNNWENITYQGRIKGFLEDGQPIPKRGGGQTINQPNLPQHFQKKIFASFFFLGGGRNLTHITHFSYISRI